MLVKPLIPIKQYTLGKFNLLNSTLIFLLFWIDISPAKSIDKGYKNLISYSGNIVNQKSQPIEGTYSVSIKLLKFDSKQVLFRQEFPKILFNEGKFSLKIGNQLNDQFVKVLALHPNLLLEIHVNRKLYGPLIAIQFTKPFLKNNLNLSNSENSIPVLTPNQVVAIQAVVLKPSINAKAVKISEKKQFNPFLLSMKGPLTSINVSNLTSSVNNKNPTSNTPNIVKEIEKAFDTKGRRYGTEISDSVDDVLAVKSLQVKASMGTIPFPSITFEGLSGTSSQSPADVAAAVGENHYIQMVNHVFAVYDKSGNQLAGPIATNTLWQGFGGVCEDNNDGDAIALYDQQADRFILSQFATRSAQSVCFAVSVSSDPLGSYYLYELPTQRLPDYYKLGVWSDPINNAYYMGTNTGSPESYDVYAIDRMSMLAGVEARSAQFFQNYPNLLMPADQDGALPAPSGSAGLFYTIIDGGEEYFGTPAPTDDSIDLYEFHVDWEFPADSYFSLLKSFKPPEITDFIWTVCGLFQRGCLPQAGSNISIDSGSWWPMQRFQYRNFGEYETLLGSWTVDALANGDHAAPRWFELRKFANSEWQVFQEGTYAPDSSHRWMSSISMNGSGDIAMVYNVVDADNSVHPGIRYSARRSNDTLGDMRPEQSLIEGTGVQTDTFRWGDYSSMDIDPSDDCRFWFAAEYIKTTGDSSWQTRIGSFDFADCVSIITSNPIQEVCTLDDVANFNFELAGHFDDTTNLSVTNCPLGATCDFSINPLIVPTTNSQLQLTGLSAGVAAGEYQIKINATDSITSSLEAATSVSLTVVEGLPVPSTLLQPINNANLVSIQKRQFIWSPSANTSFYQFELASDKNFTTLLDTSIVFGTKYISEIGLDPETVYYWRVIAGNICGQGVASTINQFTSGPLAGECLSNSRPLITEEYDFESGLQGWVSDSIEGTNNWVLATNNPNTGTQHIHITDITNQSDTVITSPTIHLPLSQAPLTLEFNNFQDMEASGENACWDGGLIEVSLDGGGLFLPIAQEKLLTDPYNGPFKSSNPLFGYQAWCGNPQVYTNSIVNIDEYAGETVTFRFRMATDSASGGDGWDIDHVKIQSCEFIEEVFENGFE